MSIDDNLRRVREQILQAADRVGRNPEEVKLIAVTKTVGVDRIGEAVKAGVRSIGENKVQEAWKKFQTFQGEVEWHMIGHLQTNKVKRALRFARLIHSVDSIRLAKEIQKQAENMERTVDILIQVNTSGEESKYGLSPDSVLDKIQKIAELSRVKINGLMTIGAFLPEPEQVRPSFRRLRELRDKVASAGIPGVEMRELSMGMTSDFEIAIEEGATMVRIGRSIFGERPD